MRSMEVFKKRRFLSPRTQCDMLPEAVHRVVEHVDDIAYNALGSVQRNCSHTKYVVRLRLMLKELRFMRRWVAEPLILIIRRWLKIIGRTVYVLQLVDNFVVPDPAPD